MANASLKQLAEEQLQNSAAVKAALVSQSEKIVTIAEALINCVKNGGCIYSCGNGGSACDAMHLTEELVARYLRERPGIRAQHFCDPSTITCWANDYAYNQVFERQAQTHLTDKDALVVFSTSGKSESILRALAAANQKGALTVALLGKGGGQAKALAKHSLIVASDTTARIQEAHISIVHVLCDLIERTLYPTA